MKSRQITYAAAIHEALDLSLKCDKNVVLIGEGVPDPTGIFGTTLGLQEKYGKERVFDMPVSEHGVTGVCIGLALRGMRPILTYQRIDFSLLAFDQIVNMAAKWYYMFGSIVPVPIVIRMIIGKGWGQGAQHSQALHALFAHIPGLKVVMPAFPSDAKGLLLASIADNNPVIFIEHRWLHSIKGEVRGGYYKVELGMAKKVRTGRDLTIVASSLMTVEALKAYEVLKSRGVQTEIIDLRTIKPWDHKLVTASVKKTGKLLVLDLGNEVSNFAKEIVSFVCRSNFKDLKSPPQLIALPDVPTPTSYKLAEKYYPSYLDIIEKSLTLMDFTKIKIGRIVGAERAKLPKYSDIPNPTFTGPF